VKTLQELAVEERAGRASDFVSMAALLMSSRGGKGEALAMAERSKGTPPRVVSVLKAAVGAGTTLNPANASSLIDLRVISSGFVASLASLGAFDRMLADGAFRRVPLATPGVRLSASIAGYGVAEGSAVPISALNIAADTVERLKAVTIVVVSDQLAEAMTPAAQALLARELRNGVIAATDVAFLRAMVDGVTPIAAVGSTAANVLGDLENLLAAVPTDSTARLYLIVDPATAKRLAVKATTTGARAFDQVTPQGGSIAGVPVVVSDWVPTSGSPGAQVVLIDASQVAADSGVVALDEAKYATLEMTDTPTMHVGGVGSPSAPVAASMVSLWQTNSRGLRASRYYGFRKLRADAVAVLGGAVW
jgi:hypothetical protein